MRHGRRGRSVPQGGRAAPEPPTLVRPHREHAAVGEIQHHLSAGCRRGRRLHPALDEWRRRALVAQVDQRVLGAGIRAAILERWPQDGEPRARLSASA